MGQLKTLKSAPALLASENVVDLAPADVIILSDHSGADTTAAQFPSALPTHFSLKSESLAPAQPVRLGGASSTSANHASVSIDSVSAHLNSLHQKKLDRAANRLKAAALLQ